MEKVINYPIKYAVLELKEQGGWLVGYEDVTQGFIAAKCYVVESKIVYHSDGSNSITHNVVFPYEDISLFKQSLQYGRQNIGSEIIPLYDACNRPYPVREVRDLFNSYEEAKIVAEQMNTEYRRNLLLEISFLKPNWKQLIELSRNEFDQTLSVSYLFEELVLEKTEDMQISEALPNDEQNSVVKNLKPVGKKWLNGKQ